MQTSVVVIVFVVSLGITGAASDQAKLCFKGTEAEPSGNVTITCPHEEVISVDEALFRRNKWGACVISDGDCVERTKIFQECDNLNNCTRSFKTYLTSCGYATFMFISYSCLQARPAATYTSTTDSTTPSTTKLADSTAAPKFLMTRKPTELVNTSDNLNDTGLIAGCVVTAVITVIALVIVITMVVRRLMHKTNPDEEDGDDDSTQSKSYSCCICIHCSITTKQSPRKHRLKAEENTTSSPPVSKKDRKQTSIKPTSISLGNDESITCPEVQTAQVPTNCYNGSNVSNQTHTGHNTTCKSQQDVDDFHKLDSNANTRMNSINKVEDIYLKYIMYSSPKVTNALNKEIAYAKKSLPQTKGTLKKEMILSQEGKGDHSIRCHVEKQVARDSGHELTNMNGPTYDAVSIPNTRRGTAC